MSSHQQTLSGGLKFHSNCKPFMKQENCEVNVLWLSLLSPCNKCIGLCLSIFIKSNVAACTLCLKWQCEQVVVRQVANWSFTPNSKVCEWHNPSLRPLAIRTTHSITQSVSHWCMPHHYQSSSNFTFLVLLCVGGETCLFCFASTIRP